MYNFFPPIDNFIINQDDQSTKGLVKLQCPFCSYCTFRPHHLQTHKLTHTGERPYQCKICSKSFSQRGNLTVHLRCHTGERPFFCRYCKKGFTQKVNLQKHKCSSTTSSFAGQ